MKKVLLFTIILTSMFSCKRIDLSKSKESLFQHIYKGAGVSKMILKNDGRFFYENEVGLSYVESRGTWWQIGNDSIVFLSDSSYLTGYIVDVLEKTSNENPTFINVVDVDGDVPLIAGVLFGENTYREADKQGVVKMIDGEYNSLSIIYLSDVLKWEFKEKPKGDLNVRVKLSDESKVYFDRDIWVLKKQKLLDPQGTVFRWKP